MNVVAGDSEEVDQSSEVAKSAAMSGFVQSGAAGSLLSSVLGAGAVLSMFGGFGGKKKARGYRDQIVGPFQRSDNRYRVRDSQE